MKPRFFSTVLWGRGLSFTEGEDRHLNLDVDESKFHTASESETRQSLLYSKSQQLLRDKQTEPLPPCSEILREHTHTHIYIHIWLEEQRKGAQGKIIH